MQLQHTPFGSKKGSEMFRKLVSLPSKKQINTLRLISQTQHCPACSYLNAYRKERQKENTDDYTYA